MIRLRPCSRVAYAWFAPLRRSNPRRGRGRYKALVGNYKVAKAELGGKDITEHLKEMKFEIRDGGKYTAQVGEHKDDATFTADPRRSPRK